MVVVAVSIAVAITLAVGVGVAVGIAVERFLAMRGLLTACGETTPLRLVTSHNCTVGAIVKPTSSHGGEL